MPTIRKRGLKWQVQIRRIGSRPFSKSFHVLKDAQAWARHMELQTDRSDLPADPRALQHITLGQLVARYRDTVTPGKRTAHAERIVLNAFLLHPICRRRLSEITRTDFAAYRDDRLKEIKPSSLKRSLVPIHNLYELAKTEWGLPIQDNPVSKLNLKGSDTKRERRLQEGEWQRLLEAGGGFRNPLLLSIIKFAVATGLRRGEMLAARWDHLDRERRALLIPQTKNGHARLFPLTIDCLNLLECVPRTTERIFPVSGNAVRLAWERPERATGRSIYQCATLAPASLPPIRPSCSRSSSRRTIQSLARRKAPAWGWPSQSASSRCMGEEFGSSRIWGRVRRFSSRSPYRCNSKQSRRQTERTMSGIDPSRTSASIRYCSSEACVALYQSTRLNRYHASSRVLAAKILGVHCNG